jgi:hypothetical protein
VFDPLPPVVGVECTLRGLSPLGAHGAARDHKRATGVQVVPPKVPSTERVRGHEGRVHVTLPPPTTKIFRLSLNGVRLRRKHSLQRLSKVARHAGAIQAAFA